MAVYTGLFEDTEILDKIEQSMKGFIMMEVTLSGNEMDVRLLQLENASSPMIRVPCGIE